MAQATTTSGTNWVEAFLLDCEPKKWSATDGVPVSIRPHTVFVQDADNGLEVAVATAERRPSTADMRKAWKARHRGRAAPVLLVVGYGRGGDTAIAVCGPAGDEPPVHFDLDPPRVERLAATALSEPNRHAAQRCLLRLLPELESKLAGLVNSGLLATHELREGVPQRSDWPNAVEEGRRSLKLRGRRLIEALGYSVEPLSTNTSLLKAGEERRAVAVFLDEGDTFDAPAKRFEGVSPVSHALAIADREHLSWVLLTRSSEIRLYTAAPDVGVGRKGRADTFVEVNLALLPQDAAGYLPLLFSAEALARDGTFEQILSSSADFAADLAARLRDRVYREAVPALARAIASRLRGTIDEDALSGAYEQALTILFRLLFVAYGEDKDLLPYDTNSRYADHSLKRMARRLADELNAGSLVFDEAATDLWEDVTQLWRAVERGNKGWGVPPYDGGLFSADPADHPVGAALGRLALTDAEFGPALSALLVDATPDRVLGPVDFRSLSVREFGTIYEGLLESELSVAANDLAIDAGGNYVPAGRRSVVEVPAGTVYLHNRSGARKATGSYFTKPFAVEHLLDHALEPALADHLRRVEDLVEAGDEAGAAAAFFDFRCADIAMGSGHFLVAAVDRIEARLSASLALHPLPPVVAELDTLRTAALEALGELAPGVEIETTSLLRRQVARRCIYGVDRNRIAVELARLAIWIHTFVPGLPLSFLDHNLVQGDSLLGVGSIDEALTALAGDDPKTGTASIARDIVVSFLQRASSALRRLGTIADATVAEVRRAQEAHVEARAKVEPATALFDLVVAHRLGRAPLPLSVDEALVLKVAADAGVRELSEELRALHFPVAFPEVFLRDRPGFDCMLGNPPWEKLQLEEHSFYALTQPGLRGLSQSDAEKELARIRRERPDLHAEYLRETARIQAMKEALVKGPYPGMTAGRPDLYKAFAWRFWQLMRGDGFTGVVLPRKAVEASGMKRWRKQLLASADFDVTMLLNSRGWVFDDVHQQWTICLLGLHAVNDGKPRLRLRGPYPSIEHYREGMLKHAIEFPASDLLSWSEAATFPLLKTPDHLRVFSKMRRHPGLCSRGPGWEPRGMRELNASDDKEHFIFGPGREGLWPVYKGESFDIWVPETGAVYAYAEPEHITEILQQRRRNQIRNRRSAFFGFSAEWANDPRTLPARHPRVAWRDSSRATDSRTVRVALVPRNTVLVHQAYTLFWRAGHPQDEAFVLGVLSSIPFDWYARQLVESHVTVEFLGAAPVPRPSSDSALRDRVVQISGRLAAVDERFETWAEAVGVPVASVVDDEAPELLAELDACVALLYGLDVADLRVIYSTFHEGADYSAHQKRVLEHYRRLR